MAKRKTRKKELTITEFARMGGLALARKRSQEQRTSAARHAVTVRWAKKQPIAAPEASQGPSGGLPEPSTSAA